MKSPRFISVTPQFSKHRMQVYIAGQLKKFEERVLERLKRVGENFVTHARSNPGYGDVTGNLKASIGYVILKDGLQILQWFPGNTEVGRDNAKRFVNKIGKDHPHGFVIIGCAGMVYAAAVESLGKNVITASSLIAKEDLRKSMQALQNKFK